MVFRGTVAHVQHCNVLWRFYSKVRLLEAIIVSTIVFALTQTARATNARCVCWHHNQEPVIYGSCCVILYGALVRTVQHIDDCERD